MTATSPGELRGPAGGLVMVVHLGVLGGVFYIALCPFWTNWPQWNSTYAPAPEIKSFNIQTTQMKCHGKFDKNQKERN